MYCVVCGAQVPDGLGRCAICGSEIAPGGAAASGSAVQPAPQPASQLLLQPPGQTPRRGPSAKGVIAALVSAAVVAIVGGGACFAFGVFGNEPLLGDGAGRVDATAPESVNTLSEKVVDRIEETAREEAERAAREEAERAAREAEEKARAEEEARLAEQTAQREQTALDFATQYYTNGSFVSADDDTQLQPIDTDVWWDLVLQYLEPGSAAVATFESTFSGPIAGLEAFCFVKDARVIESSADRVAVEVRYLATQNPAPGWSNAEGHATVFTCAFAESGLIDSYSESS